MFLGKKCIFLIGGGTGNIGHGDIFALKHRGMVTLGHGDLFAFQY